MMISTSLISTRGVDGGDEYSSDYDCMTMTSVTTTETATVITDMTMKITIATITQMLTV